MGHQFGWRDAGGRAGLALSLALMLQACAPDPILEGERFGTRVPLEQSLPVEGEAPPVAPPEQPENRSVAIALPAAAANADWAQRGGNARHDGPHGQLSAAPALQWAVSIGQGDSRQNRISAAPVVAGGRIVAMDAGSRVTAVSTAGALLWQADVAASNDRDGQLSGGGLAADGGQVFATTGYGEVVALDAASGAIQWRQPLNAPALGAPAVADGVVYAVGRDGAGWAIAASDGRVLWQVNGLPSPTAVVGAAAPAVSGDLVYLPFGQGEVRAITRADGTPLWVAALSGQRLGRGYGVLGSVTGDPVVAGGVVYAGTAAGRTAALDAATGERLWTTNEGAINPPLVVGGSVFAVNDEARLVRLDAASGEVIWGVDMPYFTEDKDRKRKAIYAHFGPVLAGGRLVVASSDGMLRMFDPASGTLTGSAEIPGGAITAPALAGGALYVVSSKGQLLAFR